MQVTSSSYANAVYAVQATQTLSKTASVDETQQLTRLEQMQEKYKDVYTPIPETYSAEDEAFQQQKIQEAYPDWPTPEEFFNIFNSYYDAEPLRAGQKEATKEQLDGQEYAYQKTYEHFGGLNKFKEMMEGVRTIKNQYPFNKWAKDGFADNAKELARFHNAAVYEGMEQGLSLNDATKQAHAFESSFMDTSYKTKEWDAFFAKFDKELLEKAGMHVVSSDTERKAEKHKIDFDAPNNSTMDLRRYGIEGAWSTHKIIENQDAMLQEIVKKIGQFNFMLNNKSLIEDAYMKLDAGYHNMANNAGYERWINKELMPEMQLGHAVFSQYKIYDSVNIKV